MIRQRRRRVAAAHERAGGGPDTADSAWPERYRRWIRAARRYPL